MQSETLVRQVFPDHCHVQVGSIPATEFPRQAVAQPARGIGAAAHLVEQVFPLASGYTTVVQIGAGELTTPVEVLHVLALQRLDLRVDERIHLGQQRRKMLGEDEIHQVSFGSVPYMVLRQMVDSVATASSSETLAARLTLVKRSNGRAMARP